MKRIDTWILGFVIFHRTFIIQSENTDSYKPANGQVLVTGFNENPTVDKFKRVYRNHKYHRKIVTSNVGKLLSTPTNYNEVIKISTNVYKRHYKTMSRLKKNSVKWRIKTIPRMNTLAISQHNTVQLKEITTRPKDIQIENITNTTINSNVDIKTSENNFCNSTMPILAVNRTNPITFTDDTSIENKTTQRCTENENYEDDDYFKGSIYSLVPFSLIMRTTTEKLSNKHSKIETNDDYKITEHPTSTPDLFTYATVKEKSPVTQTSLQLSVNNSSGTNPQNHCPSYLKCNSTTNKNLINNTSYLKPLRSTKGLFNFFNFRNNKFTTQKFNAPTTLICFSCSKPVRPVYTLTKPKLSMSSKKYLKPFQKLTQPISTIKVKYISSNQHNQ